MPEILRRRAALLDRRPRACVGAAERGPEQPRLHLRGGASGGLSTGPIAICLVPAQLSRVCGDAGEDEFFETAEALQFDQPRALVARLLACGTCGGAGRLRGPFERAIARSAARELGGA